MHIQLLPPQIRMINPYLPLTRFAATKLGASPIQSSRSVSTFSKLFPFKLKYSGLQCHGTGRKLVYRPLSSRPMRSQTSSRSEMMGRGEIRASKSLVDDEAELSDWVSELRPDSFGRNFSSDGDSELERGGGRGRGGSVRGGRMGGRSGDRDGMSRRRESDFDTGASRRRDGPSSFDSPSGRGRFDRNGRSSSGRYDDLSERFGRNGGGGEFNRRDVKTPSESVYRRSSGTSERFGSGRGGGEFRRRGEKAPFESVSRRNVSEPATKRRSERDIGGGKGGEVYQRSEGNGSRGGSSSSVTKRSSSALIGTEKARGRFLTSDKENDEVEDDSDEDKELSDIGGLLSDEDSEDDDEDEGKEDEVDLIEKKANSSLGFDREVIRKSLAGSSTDQSESYLSETR